MKDILEAFRMYNVRQKEYDDARGRLISGAYLVNISNYKNRLKMAEEELERVFNKAVEDRIIKIINCK